MVAITFYNKISPQICITANTKISKKRFFYSVPHGRLNSLENKWIAHLIRRRKKSRESLSLFLLVELFCKCFIFNISLFSVWCLRSLFTTKLLLKFVSRRTQKYQRNAFAIQVYMEDWAVKKIKELRTSYEGELNPESLSHYFY